MDMELQRVAVEGYRPLYHTAFTQEETLESIVPDALPDVSRIVAAWGRAHLKDCETGEGAIRLSGSAQVTVLYIPEGEDAPRSLEVTIPFQCAKDDPSLHAGFPAAADVTLSSADARTLNPRKLLTRCQLSIWAAAYEEGVQQLATDAMGEGLEKQMIPRKFWRIPAVREKAFTFSDVLRPPASKPEMEELLNARVELGSVDAKFIGRKLVLKGDVVLTALYRNGDQIVTARFELPYSQIVDMGDAPEDSEPEVTVALKAADCQLTDGELEVNIEALVQAVLWALQPVNVLADAYGVGQCVNVERAPEMMCTLAERTTRREMGRRLCESGIPAKQVLDCAVAVSSVTEAPAEGGIEYTAQVEATVLYLSEDDALCGVDVTIPVVSRVEVPAEHSRSICHCRTVGEPTAVPVTGGIEVRCEVEFSFNVVQAEPVWAVSSLAPGTAPENVQRPSVVIRRMMDGETLWDVAKACASTVSDIQAANDLPDPAGAAGALLLIPTKR